MPQPDFTPHEKALIARIDDPQSSNRLFELAYLVPSALLVGVGFAYDAPAAFACAFAVIFTFRVIDMRGHSRALPLFRSVLQKYRQACSGE